MNNREFKFRIWDADENYWRETCEISQSGIVTSSWGKEKYNWIIQQFTGLLDKNNKEIYEGDIIKAIMEKGPHCRYPDIKIHDNQKVRIGEVKWDNYSDGEYVEKIECYIFDDNSLSELIYRTKGNYQEYIYTYEIIGNVFENKELLS